MERLPFLSAALNIIAHWRSSHPPSSRGGGRAAAAAAAAAALVHRKSRSLPPNGDGQIEVGPVGVSLSLFFL